MLFRVESKNFFLSGMILVSKGFTDVKIDKTTTNTIIAEWRNGLARKSVADVRIIVLETPGLLSSTWLSGGWSSKELV